MFLQTEEQTRKRNTTNHKENNISVPKHTMFTPFCNNWLTKLDYIPVFLVFLEKCFDGLSPQSRLINNGAI